MSEATIDPSPTAAATRLVDPCRTSPAAKSPTRLVSSASGSRSSGQQSGRPAWPPRAGPGGGEPRAARRPGLAPQVGPGEDEAAVVRDHVPPRAPLGVGPAAQAEEGAVDPPRLVP